MKKALFTFGALCAALMLGGIAQTQAAEQVDPSGTWKWTSPGRNNGPERKSTLMLKSEKSKLIGKLSTAGRDGQPRVTEISDGKVKGDEVMFNIVREWNGNKFTIKYHGKIKGNDLVGKIDMERNGQTRSREWKAKRAEVKK